MGLEKLLKEIEHLNHEDQEKIRKLISDDFILKSNVIALQKELNDISQENNLVRQQIAKKFSNKEHQTISFQLGKGLISAFKGEKKLKELPMFGAGLFLDALARKNGQELSPLQQKIYPLVEYQEAFANHNYKKITAAILKSIVNKLEDNKAPNDKPLEGEYQELKKVTQPKIELTLEAKHTVQQIIEKPEIQQSQMQDNRLKIACIMDEFTYFCFSPEAELLQLTPENWLDEISEFKPDMLFVESAWQGKESLWKAKVSQNTSEIQQLIKFCKVNSIKSMFWNKEDPVHFGTFIDVAKQVDVVFTTDIDCIAKYKAEVGHDDVYLMPFAAQPHTHNPIEKYQRKDAFNFAGSFYLKYPERQRDFVNLTAVATEVKSLDIYDRNYNNPHPHYQFPDQYKPYILGRLEPHEIDKAYKGYTYGINMNTIKQSQSMFARRVFEMICSNTIVLSNYSRGVRNFFGDLVLCSDNKDELISKLKLITQDHDTRDAFKLMGLRKVLSEHTYEDRIEYILSKLKINYELNDYHVNVLAKVDSMEEYEKIIKMFNLQSCKEKQLLIYNPHQLDLGLNTETKVFESMDVLNKFVLEQQQSYFAFFSSKDLYLEHYLEDMLLSFKYLKHHDNLIVTKNSYYKKSSKVVSLVSGQEYNYVDQAQLRSSMMRLEDIECIHKFFENEDLVLNQKSFSIDRFSYVNNASELNEVDQNKVLANIQSIETGVELKAKLLPYAEGIKAIQVDQDVHVELSVEGFKDYVKSDYKLVQVECDAVACSISSKLEKLNHRYISVLPIQKVIGQELEVYVEANGALKTQAVIQFYNGLNKIEFKVVDINSKNTILIPEQAQKFDLSLRLKGPGSIQLTKISYAFKSKQQNNVLAEKNSNIVSLDAEVFNSELIKGSSNQIQFFKQDGQPFVIKTTLGPAKHAYMYMKKIFTRDELNLVLNSEFELKAKSTAEDVRIVFEFQDENKQKISHSMNPILGGHALAIPMHCKYVRLGLKIVGAGVTEISSLDIGVVKNPIINFIPKSDVLVVAKQYPSYEDLYKYGFLHTRLKGYKQQNKLVNMFRVTSKAEEFGFSEFEGIDVVSHNHKMLDKLLASGVYKKVCIHLLDSKIWEVVQKYKDQIEILIWIHGADIRSWERKSFEADSLSAAEVVRQKKLSEQRKRFWKNILLNDLGVKVQFIFVSQYFREESEQDLGVKFPDNQCHIIHNYIDSSIFTYETKSVSQRFKILSIRPFANKTYANDLTVNAILELAKKPNFKKFDIAIYGEGVLFDELTAPLKQFSNVSLNKTFLTHSQIAALHKSYGVFLVPTRLDSQGVSRGEAMASGLVPITTNVAAIPEFVDEQSGIIVPPEDYKALAESIYSLSKNSSRFKKLSFNTFNRVNQQCGFKLTIKNEIELL